MGDLVTLQALSSILTNPHSCFAWSYKALAMLADMWSVRWQLEGRGREDSHRACDLFDNKLSIIRTWFFKAVLN